MNTFLNKGDELYTVLGDKYWTDPSRQTVEVLGLLVADMERMLDLRNIAPAARGTLGRDAIFHLYEVLSRIELPPEAEIPDTVIHSDSVEPDEAGAAARSWTIPNTEISLVPIADEDGTYKYRFSAATVRDSQSFYDKTRSLEYRREVPLQNYMEMRPYLAMSGWVVPAQVIENFPDWLKRDFHQQAVWKWIVLFTVLLMTAFTVYAIHRLARRGLSGHSTENQLRRLLTPLLLLFIPYVLDVVNQQLSLVGKVSGALLLLEGVIGYFALAWVIWTGCIAIAEAAIASPRISAKGLNAHLFRLLARATGILGVIGVLLYVANEVGLPVYGLVTGIGVGGIAVALAVRPILENIFSGLILFTDKPVRIGDFCRFGDEEGTVEDVGFRSTRIRKRDDTLISVPNSDFVQRDLYNYGRRRTRLFEAMLGLRYETTAEQLRYVIAKLREMLHGHPKVSPADLHVRFAGFGAFSLDVRVFAYLRTRDWLTFQAISEDLNLRIMDIVRDAGTGFAFPSQTTYLARDTGLDAELVRGAEDKVRQWRSSGELPFPEFDDASVQEKEDTLDYPPEGSPDYKPHDPPGDKS